MERLWVTGSIGVGPNGEDLTALKAQVRAYASRMENGDLVVPAGQRARYEAAFAKFSCRLPRCVLRERARPFLSRRVGRQRPPAERRIPQRDGVHARRSPLSELILDEKGKKELEALWDQFEFVADYTARTYVQFYFNQSGEVLGNGPESGTLRPSDKDITAEAVILNFKSTFLAKAAADDTNNPVAMQAIADHFDRVNATLRADRTGTARSGAAPAGRADDICGARVSQTAVTGRARGSAGVLPLAARQEEPDARRGDARLDRQRADVAVFLLSPRPG